MTTSNKSGPVRAGRIPRTALRAGSRLLNSCAGAFYNAQQKGFDLVMRASTRGVVVTGDTMFNTGGDNCPYEGCQWPSVRWVLENLNPGPSDVFVDLGSGKGKALLIAGRLPYRRVVGVEIDEDLARCAARNIDRARPRLRAQGVECITANVREWPVTDEASVIFMCNPFIGDTFRSAVSSIFESYDRNPRALHIVYEHPWEHDWLLSTGRVVVDSVRASTWPARPRWWKGGDVIVTYQVTGPAGAEPPKRPTARPLFQSRQAMQRWSVPNGHRFGMSVPGYDQIYTSS